jgi:predicted RecA/RadA family phage recombinase
MRSGRYIRRRFAAPSGGAVKGTLYLIGGLAVVARSNAAEGAYFIAAQGGIWTIAKTSAQAWTEGQKIYRHAGTGAADSDGTTGPLIGVAAAEADNPSSTGSVLLHGTAPATPPGVDTTELGLLDGATAGSVTASKVVSRDAGKRVPVEYATVAAAGSTAGDAAAITAQYTRVTAADGTKGVILPVGVANLLMVVENSVAGSALKVYPDTGGTINSESANVAVSVGGGQRALFIATAALTWVVAPNDLLALLSGVAAGYKVARGQETIHPSAVATATVVTGLATVVAVVATPDADPDGTNLAAVSATIGDQAGSPAAGSVILKTWKITAADNGALVAATADTDYEVNWIAIGI